MSAREKKTILLVEDEVIIAITTKALLEDNGYEAIEAHNGENAVRLAEENPSIDLILMDIDLGRGMDGTEAARLILESREIPIVFLTSHSEREMVDRVKHITRYGYVIKNSGDFVLLSSIEMAFELFEAHRTMKDSSERFRGVFEKSPVGIAVVDTVTQRILQANRSFCEITGYSEDELLSMTVGNITHPEDWEKERRLISRRLDLIENDYNFEKRYVRKNGEIRRVRVTGDVLHLKSGAPPVAIANVIDVTERRKMEEDLRYRETLLEKVFDLLPIGLWFTDSNGKIFRGNPAGNRIWGAEPHVAPKEYGVFKARRLPSGEEISPEDWAMARTIREGITVIDELLEIDTFDGQKKIILNYSAPVVDDSGTMLGAIAMNQEVTARIRAEKALSESEERLQAVFRAAPTGIGVSLDRVLLDVNKWICEMTGYARDELIGRSSRVLYPSQKEFDYVGTESVRQITELGMSTIEIQWLKKGGETMDVLLSSTPIDMADLSAGVVFTVLDISGRKLVERQNLSLLAEKETLLKEVHHRIKNNMNTIASLLALQARGLSSESAVAALTDARSRVNTMMEIYEKLYRSPDYRSIRASDYLGRLIESIRLTYSTGDPVRVEKMFDDINLDSRVLFPVGMIVNELLTNALRHAFPKGESGDIEVRLAQTGEMIELTVSDNGEGMPPQVGIDNSGSFGLVLVGTLVEQLGGSLELDRANGTSWTIRFPG